MFPLIKTEQSMKIMHIHLKLFQFYLLMPAMISKNDFQHFSNRVMNEKRRIQGLKQKRMKKMMSNCFRNLTLMSRRKYYHSQSVHLHKCTLNVHKAKMSKEGQGQDTYTEGQDS